MTPNEFQKQLEALRDKGTASCAFLASCDNETFVGRITICCKQNLAYPSSLRFAVCGRASNVNHFKSEQLKAEYQHVRDFLMQHWNDLEFEILKISQRSPFPRDELRDLYEKYQPSLTPTRNKIAEERLTSGNAENRKYRKGYLEHHNEQARINWKKNPLLKINKREYVKRRSETDPEYRKMKNEASRRYAKRHPEKVRLPKQIGEGIIEKE